MTVPKKRSISKNLTISLVVVIAFLSTTFISIYYLQISKREKTRLESTADEYIHSIASTLEVPLWDIDRENIKTICDYYNRNDLVVMVKLIGISGEVLYQSRLKTKTDTDVLITRSQNIFYAGEQIGRVAMALSPLRSQEAKQGLLKVFVFVLLISVVGLVFSTGFLLKKFLKEPMAFMAGIAKSYSEGDYHPPLGDVRYKEFAPLVAALVEMGETIESQMNALQSVEASLKKHKETLEKRIALRTRELEASNRDLQNEIKDRKNAQTALKANEQRLAAILRASPIGIGLAVNRQMEWANETLYKMLGYEKNEILGKNTRILYRSDKEYQRVGIRLHQNVIQAEIADIETQLVRKDGSAFDCTIRAYALNHSDLSKGQIISISDISEAKLLERKLQRSEKLEAIGTLAGGVAHDLNNILSGIVSYPEILLVDIPKESSLRKPLETIQKSGERAVEIVQDLLTMARRGVSVTEVVNLNQIVSDQLKSPEVDKLKSFHPGVQIMPALEPDLLNVKGSSTHISKCIMNIVSNAAEAMPNGGKIALSTSNIYLDTPVKGYENIKEGDYVKISVSDTGVGMSKTDTERIFEPFYTKKKMGRSGTGLGMAVVWGTIKDHQGYIDILSSEGRGTTFTLYFPVTREKLKKGEIDASLDEYKGDGESVLIIDDVEEQREIATIILQKLDYSVSSVSGGEEAVEFLKHNSVDLLVLDMIMEPGIDGLDTYKKIVEIHPEQKAIIASGFSRTDRVKELQRLGAGQYVKKPYTLGKIGSAVRSELEK